MPDHTVPDSDLYTLCLDDFLTRYRAFFRAAPNSSAQHSAATGIYDAEHGRGLTRGWRNLWRDGYYGVKQLARRTAEAEHVASQGGDCCAVFADPTAKNGDRMVCAGCGRERTFCVSEESDGPGGWFDDFVPLDDELAEVA